MKSIQAILFDPDGTLFDRTRAQQLVLDVIRAEMPGLSSGMERGDVSRAFAGSAELLSLESRGSQFRLDGEADSEPLWTALEPDHRQWLVDNPIERLECLPRGRHVATCQREPGPVEGETRQCAAGQKDRLEAPVPLRVPESEHHAGHTPFHRRNPDQAHLLEGTPLLQLRGPDLFDQDWRPCFRLEGPLG